MARKDAKPASPADVRAWLAANPVEGETLGSRGRFSATQIKRFHKANPRRAYVVGAPVKSVQIKVGRKPHAFTPAEVRRIAAEQGVEVPERGRLSAEVLAAVQTSLTPAPTVEA